MLLFRENYMEINQIYNLLKKGKKVILLSVLIFVLAAVGIIAVQSLKFGAESRLLIVQNANSGNDPYAVAKSNDYISSVLSSVVASNSFYHEVLNSGYNIDQSYFTSDIKKQMEKWQKTVAPTALSDAGIIKINVYHPDKNQAEQIALAINYTLKVKSAEYLSTGNRVDLKVLDQPTLSNWPVKPNIPLNLVLAIVLGFVFGLSYQYVKSSVEDTVFVVADNNDLNKGDEEIPTESFDSYKQEEVRETVNENTQQEEQESEPLVTPAIYGMEQNMAYEDITQEGDMKNILY